MIFAYFEELSGEALIREIGIRQRLIRKYALADKVIMCYFALGELLELCGVPKRPEPPVKVEEGSMTMRCIQSKAALMLEIDIALRN